MCAGISNPDHPGYSCDCHLDDDAQPPSEACSRCGREFSRRLGYCLVCLWPLV